MKNQKQGVGKVVLFAGLSTALALGVIASVYPRSNPGVGAIARTERIKQLDAAIFYVKTRQQIIPRSERAKYSDGFINYSIICIEGFNNTFLNKNEYLVTSNNNPLTKVDDKTLSSGVIIPSYTFKDPGAVEKWNISEIKPKPENKEKTVTPSLSPWQ